MQINGKKEERLASTLVPRVFAARSSHVLLISVTQKENKRLLKAYYQILNFFSFFFQFSGQLRVFHCMFTATFPVCVLFCTDVSYVIGITYQTIDKSLISELLGGLQGM